MQSFSHPLFFNTSSLDKRKPPKLFSGIDTARDIHLHLNPKPKSRRPKPFAVASFTLPYRNLPMNHSNDKSTKTKSKKKPKKKTAQNKQPAQKTTQAQPLRLPAALPTRTMAQPQRNEPGISERRGIRWLPDDHQLEEPTSTLVLTSSQGRFVDVRIFCNPGEILPNEGGPSSLLDWGIAGTSTSTVIQGPSLDHPSNPPPPADGSLRSVCHSTFSHWIDSRTDTPGPDQGDMYPQPNNTTLELGAMYNPLTHSEQPYEEVWVDYSASAVEGTRWSVVIDLDDPEHKAKGRVVRVGEHCQAILKVGEQTTVERWKFEAPEKDTKRGWERLARLGDLYLPVSLAFTPERVIEGNTLTYGDYNWMVKEVYSW
ncbi:hypothetical protein E4T48_00181 [Aureobasidium sp. EXF-10727]|nr:hypothetical protein E4T48_00181 [Aureobasidium sp. EXF-10727]